ncbi:hypothetical protein JD844_002751 [Phrynosoma platyrhinos]|uniref:Uncharacterized protein n=1 Tax=Phrynosoma platyrhinos TaxID=52577 RepID=A0ABQ7TCT7_PHRPL|nr:hypothetical protein JD844_002751 [Phrynosoma platyrhinos]
MTVCANSAIFLHKLMDSLVADDAFIRAIESHGIERLKKQEPTWEKVSGWEGLKLAFGGDLSLRWFNPFSDLSCQKSPPAGTATVAPSEMVAQEAFEQLSDQEVVVEMS